MNTRLLSRLLVGLVVLLPIVAGAAQNPRVDFGAQRLPVDFKSPQPLPANLSITTFASGNQPARLLFTSESAKVDAKGVGLKVTYTSTGLVVEMVSGEYTEIRTQTPWQSRTGGDFKTLYLTFGSNGQLMSVRAD